LPGTEKTTAKAAISSQTNGQNPQGTPPTAQANAQAMREIMEELRQLGALDPAAQNKLMEDLKQTDPALWPLVMQQFRAAIAYKHRSAQREATEAVDSPQAGGSFSSSDNQYGGRIGRLPAVADARAEPNPPSTAPKPLTKDCYSAASELPVASQKVEPNLDNRSIKETDKAVIKASYNEPVAQSRDDWQGRLTAAIKALETSAPSDPKTAEELARQARLRMLYAMAGRRDEAMKPIPSAPPAVQEFWSKEIYALTMLLDADKNPDAARRAAEGKQILCEAISRLGETAPLVVRNLSFCTAIQSYGCFTPFKKYEFTPDQEVLLYAEVENFASESTPKGFHTQLRSSYQILDSAGQRVADHTFSTTEEYCQNSRRDFFIWYDFHMPKRINPGNYTLQLTIEDLKSQKVGQSTVELTIKDSGK
jgi:hypothetical protein